MYSLIKYFAKKNKTLNTENDSKSNIKNTLTSNVKIDNNKNQNVKIEQKQIIDEKKYMITDDIFVLDTLNEGGRSKVYLVEDNSKNKFVCKKMDMRYYKNALREICILNKLKNNKYFPNYNFFIEKPRFIAILSDYHDAMDLFDYTNKLIYKNILTNDTAKEIFIKMLMPVIELHKLGFNHLDIKMENYIILNNKNLDVKLIDFEMSYEYTVKLKNSSKQIGTSGYSPIESYNYLYNYKTDIWSLGVCLWILLSYEMPFNHKNINTKNFKKEYVSRFVLEPTEDDYEYIHKDALDLVQKMLTINLKDRIELEDILKHKWINS